MRALDRTGIFKAKPLSWRVKESGISESRAVSIQFKVLEQLGDGREWIDWSEYDPHQVWGDFWIIGKTGQVNAEKVEQLAEATGWNGDPDAVLNGYPPDCVVQITVKEKEYKGEVRYEADWIRPGDYEPPAKGPTEEDARRFKAEFGSLLRAAAAGASKKATPAKAPAKKAAPPKAKGADAPDDPATPEDSDWSLQAEEAPAIDPGSVPF